MIVRCPSCSSRRDIPNFRPDAGGSLVDCGACGHHWIEGRAQEIVRLPAVIAAQDEDPPADADAAPEIRRIVEAAREAEKIFEQKRNRRRVMAAAWGGLALAAMSPALVFLAFPEQVVAAVPASNVLYVWMGREVNIYGLDIRKVELQQLLVDGQKMITVKGEIVNVSQSARKLPWLRFGLTSRSHAEVYHWTLDTESRPLKPGESKSFMTRLASPPETARALQIRFARADEIGSNKAP